MDQSAVMINFLEASGAIEKIRCDDPRFGAMHYSLKAKTKNSVDRHQNKSSHMVFFQSEN